MAPTYALRVSASAALTDCIIVLNAAVSESTSSEKPVSGTGLSKSRDFVISDSDCDSVPIGREIVRASQTLANAASANEPMAINNTEISARCMGPRADAPIESSA